MINELFERELRNTSINNISLADYIKENYVPKKSGKWIPVGKKNPVAFEKVLVTFRLHYDDSIHIGIGNTTSNVNGRYYWNLDEQDFKTWDILAWMPLPEPYKAESEG